MGLLSCAHNFGFVTFVIQQHVKIHSNLQNNFGQSIRSQIYQQKIIHLNIYHAAQYIDLHPHTWFLGSLMNVTIEIEGPTQILKNEVKHSTIYIRIFIDIFTKRMN